ncbi:MAG: sodium:calcium antiporter [Hyphomicrobiales bacterium]
MNFAALPVGINLAAFCLAATLVWFSGTRLAVYADEVSERLNLAKAFIGLIFLATATELPELVTTISAAHAGNAQLVLGNMFGGVTMQTTILAVADIFVVRHALTSWPRKPTHALEAVMLVILLGILLIITFLGDVAIIFGIGVGALCLSIAYPLVIALLRQYDERTSWAPVDIPEEPAKNGTRPFGRDRLDDVSTRGLFTRSGVCVILILIAGYTLAQSADAIAHQTGLSASFVGVTLLAASTSLPELSTTLAAARIGAYTMAISNIFGSNLIMLALIFPADIFYRAGPILSQADDAAKFSLATGIVVTAIYIAGILIRRTPKLFGAGLDSIFVLLIYIASLFTLYVLQ